MASESIKVLLIDEDKECCQILRAWIEELHCAIHTAFTVQDAREQFSVFRPQICIIDAHLAEYSAVKLTQEFCQEDPRILVAVLTVFSEEQLVIEILKAGAADFLKKPLEHKELEAVMRRFLGMIKRRQLRLMRQELFKSATLELELLSSMRVIPPTVSLLKELLSGVLDERELARLGLGLEEVLRNAHEHGNLGLSFVEKSAACAAGCFEAEVELRERKAQAEGKLIHVKAELREGFFYCRIRDEGSGFNWQTEQLLQETESAEPQLHGRGLVLAFNAFDEMLYNDLGNEVLLVKRLS